MLKVMLIDDEPLIREGLRSIIDWQYYGYQVVGTANNGRVGLEKIKELRPDVVFVDIRMPGLSGIEMVKQVKEKGYSCKFVVLSGYSNFTYAQESIRLGVESYLLKPVDEDELVSLIQDLHEKCTEENLLYSQLDQYETMTENEAWKIYLEERRKKHYVLDQYTNTMFQIASVTFVEPIEKRWLESNVATEHLFKYVWSNQVLYLLFTGTDIAAMKRQLQSISRLLTSKQHQFQLLEEDIPFEQLPEKINELKQLQKLYFVYGNETMITNKQQRIERQILPDDWITNVCRVIEFDEQDKLHTYLEELEHYYQKNHYQRERVVTELVELTKDIYLALSKNHQEVSVPSVEQMTDMLLNSHTLQELLVSVEQQLRQTSSELNGFACNPENTIEKIIEFVEQFYYKDLNLKVIAELFNYNRSYLGKKFKKQTGDYFHHYLDKVRMEKAQYFLIEKKMKVYEVSEKVGYANNDYFYKKFKKYAGVSPKEFQKQNRIEHV
ncbi:response regulator [Gracilibacillus sp. S3-1-1]|uniref:Response regulator n=1 Tax=Gracilibacillus pellucidus TaxID=3095368 RepID=A0ACC6M0U2_9BACI|nr:response regulator [Gracilibacillus sp. S3-1-1]MDX8044559.1 response regulator [Gracilibacillus sp. S3-1-1]